MKKGYSHFLLCCIAMFFLSCEVTSSLTVDEDTDPNPEVATSEAVPDVIRPILLIDPIGVEGVVETANTEIHGRIITVNDITLFTATLNANPTVDNTAILATDGRFSIPLEILNEGINTVTLNVTDSLNASTSLNITITYTKPVVTPDPVESGDDDANTQPDQPANDNTDLMSLILDILNTTQGQYEDLAHILEIFTDNEEALQDIADFLSAWNGSDSDMQTWWNDWANAGNAKNSQPHLSNSISEQTLGNSWQLDDVRISLNDIEHLTSMLAPQLVDTLKDVENNTDFVALQNHKDVLWCDFEWTVTITKVTSSLNLTADSITNIKFLDSKQVSISLNLDKAELDSNFKLLANPPKACVFNDSTRTGQIHAQKLTGTLVLQLDYDADAKTLVVTDIVSSSLSVGSVSSSMDATDGFWQSITEWIFKRLHGCTFCSGEDAEKELFQYIFDIDDSEPYKTMFNTALQKDDHIQNLLVDEFNKIFTSSLQFNGSLTPNDSAQSFQYQTAMNDFTTGTSDNQLISIWSMSVDATQPRDNCARLFKIPTASDTVPSQMPKLGDIGVQLTYDHIATILKGIARTGAFCLSQDIQFDNFTLAELDLRPYGTIAIAESENRGSQIDVTYPFEVDVNWGNDATGNQNLNMTILADNNSNNKIYGNLLLSLHFATNCDSGLTLSVDKMSLLDMAGTLKINNYSFDLEIIEDEVTDWLSHLTLTELQNIPITNNIVDLTDLPGLAVQIDNEFVTTATDINFGLTLVNDATCQ